MQVHFKQNFTVVVRWTMLIFPSVHGCICQSFLPADYLPNEVNDGKNPENIEE